MRHLGGGGGSDVFLTVKGGRDLSKGLGDALGRSALGVGVAKSFYQSPKGTKWLASLPISSLKRHAKPIGLTSKKHALEESANRTLKSAPTKSTMNNARANL